MSVQELIVYPREGLGKQAVGRLRRKGLMPCVIYGLAAPAASVSVTPKIVNKILRSDKGLNSVLNLRLEGTTETRHVMIKSVDRHPVTDRLLHVDFMRISMDQKLQLVVPIHLTGEPEGVKLGGILNIVEHDLKVECLPGHIPGVISVDASGLGMDEALRVKDLPELEGVEYLLEPNNVIAVVHPPEEEEVADEEEAVEDGVAVAAEPAGD
jgi:large subunit ribosomal protein L25